MVNLMFVSLLSGLNFMSWPSHDNPLFRVQRAAQVTPVVFATAGTFPCRNGGYFIRFAYILQLLTAFIPSLDNTFRPGTSAEDC